MEALTKAARLTPEQHRWLAMGRFEVHEWMNCAPGTPGAALLDLLRDRLVESDGRHVDRLTSTCTVTRAGRDAYVSYGLPYVPLTPLTS